MKTSTSKTELYTKEEFTSYWDGAGIKELKQALNNLKQKNKHYPKSSLSENTSSLEKSHK